MASASTNRRLHRAGRWPVVLAVLMFVAHRAAILRWAFDRTFFWEETYRLLVTAALRGHWRIPLLDLQADPYAGGSLVLPLLAVPMTAVFGTSVMTLKWVALLWSAAGLVVWMILVDRYFGWRVATTFGICFVFAPPLFVIYNLVAMGSHAETVTLSAVQCLLAFRYIYDGRRSMLALAGWGAFAGVSAWFTYVSAVTFGVCVATALVAGALPPRRWAPLAGAFLVGFSPWVVANLRSGGAGFAVVVRTFGGGGGTGRGPFGFVAHAFDLVKAGLPAAMRFQDLQLSLGGFRVRIVRHVLWYTYFAGFLAAWAACAWSFAKAVARGAGGVGTSLRTAVATHPESALLLLFPVFTLVIAASNHELNELGVVPFLTFRIVVPMFPAIFFALALAISWLPAPARRGCVAALVALGLLGTGQLLAASTGDRPRIEREARALGAEAMGHLLMYKHGPDMALIAARIAAIDEDLRAPAYRGIGFSLAYRYATEGSVDAFVEKLRAVPLPYRAAAVAGARLALGPGMEQVRPVDASERTRAMREALAATTGSP